MASHLKDTLLHGSDHEGTHASDSRWRHQEGHSYATHARNPSRSKERSRDPSTQPSIDGIETALPKDEDEDEDEDERAAASRQSRRIKSVSSDLVDFLNDSRVTPAGDGVGKGRHIPIFVKGSHGEEFADGFAARSSNGYLLQEEAAAFEGLGYGWSIRCGPLLNYRRMEDEVWHGSVLIVVKTVEAGNKVPVLEMKKTGHGNSLHDNGVSNGLPNGKLPSVTNTTDESEDNFVSATSSAIASVEASHNEANGLEEIPETGASQDTGNETLQKGHSTAENSLAGQTLRALAKDPSASISSTEALTKIEGTKLYSDPQNTFFRFDLSVPMLPTEQKISYTIPDLHFPIETKKTGSQHFYVPAKTESMRIMFHSCNGFSVGTDEAAWSGACLWNDVLRVHEKTPFHVMLGGGDQIYNDGIRVHGPLRKWTDQKNPIKRREYPFPESLRKECDDYYVKNYTRWYSTEPFASANGQIPQLNLWDDHDIIDGFGSYVSEFMQCPVFRGIGGVAHKYYMLFQHHLAPPKSTYTTDAPKTMTLGPNGIGADPKQDMDTFVYEERTQDPGYIIGAKPGPYVAERSMSIYARLGARIAFFGIDARTERTRHQVNYPDTYDLIFERLRKELTAAASSTSPIQHLIVLLGIPIAYPRLTWLENVFTSPIMGPIKFLNKRFGLAGGLFNHFDGSVDLLDDLDDHYTAKAHKKERRLLVERFQALAAEFSVRISILGGDVHLAAVGRFYSNPKLNIAPEADPRYMVNVISSAIVNKPPPAPIANLLARRNKIHRLNEKTDESLLKMFDKDPGPTIKTANSNHVTMPSRNWAMITENYPHHTPEKILDTSSVNGASISPVPEVAPTQTPTATSNGPITTNGTRSTTSSNDNPNKIRKVPTSRGTPNTSTSVNRTRTSSSTLHSKNGRLPIGPGEEGAGSKHRAAGDDHGKAGDGSLDVMIRVEIDQHDSEGKTMGYGMQIPALRCSQSTATIIVNEVLAENKKGEEILGERGGVNGQGFVNGDSGVAGIAVIDHEGVKREERGEELDGVPSMAELTTVRTNYSDQGTQTSPKKEDFTSSQSSKKEEISLAAL